MAATQSIHDYIKAQSPATSVITEEMVRLRLMDSAGRQNVLDLGVVFSTREIASAMIQAAADFNGMEPAVATVNPSSIPNLGFMMDAILAYVFLAKMIPEQDLDVASSTGNSSTDSAARRVAHYTSNAATHMRTFREYALRYKQQTNRSMGWGQIG